MADEFTPDENEEFEFRARAEQEARAGRAKPIETPAEVPSGPVEPSLGEKIVGAAQIPFQAVAEHPAVAAGALGLYKAGTMANKYIEGQRIAANAAQTTANADVMNALGKQYTTLATSLQKAGHDLRQYSANGTKTLPNTPEVQALQEYIKNTQAQMADVSKKIASNPSFASTQVAEQPGMLQRAGQLYNRYAPVIGQRIGQVGEALAPVGRVLEPVAKLGGVGGQALFHSGGLNTNEEEELRKRRALGYVNPNATNAISSGFANQLNALSK